MSGAYIHVDRSDEATGVVVTTVTTAWNPSVVEIRQCLVTQASMMYSQNPSLLLRYYIGTYNGLHIPFPSRVRETVCSVWKDRPFELHFHVFDMSPEAGLRDYYQAPLSFGLTRNDNSLLSSYAAWYHATYGRPPDYNLRRRDTWPGLAGEAHDAWDADYIGANVRDANLAGAYLFDECECTRGW